MSEKPQHIGLDSKPAIERDRIDLNSEISGADTGRIKRFLTSEEDDLHGDTSKKKKEERQTNMLMYLLENDAQYAAAYFQLQDTLNTAQTATKDALSGLDNQIAETENTLIEMDENATTLDDDTKVFQAADGTVYTEDGRKLSEDEASGLQFDENASSWEAYKHQKDELDRLNREREEVIRYQRDVLDPIRTHMDDTNEPPSRDDLDKYGDRINEEMPDIVRKHLSSAEPENSVHSSVAQDVMGASPLSVPDFASAFSSASTADENMPIPEEAVPTFEIPDITPS